MGKREELESSLGLIDTWLDFMSWYHVVPGVVVGIQLGDQTIYERAFGFADLTSRRPMTVDTRFRIASHSKLFTATAIMRLVDQGRLQLDDRIATHLDWFRSPRDANMADVTVRSLLTHSSGLNRDGTTAHWLDDLFPDREAIIAQAPSGVSVFAAGEHWKYSNLGYTLLGQVIEAVTGMTFEQAVTSIVTEPLRLGSTTPDIDDSIRADHATGYGVRYPGRARETFDHVHARGMNSATGFSSTAADLLKFYAGHRLGDTRILSDAAKREMHRMQYVDGGYRWAVGFAVDESYGTHAIGHGGAYPGFMTQSLRLIDDDVTVVVLTNAMDGRPQLFLDGICRIVRHAFAEVAALAANEQDEPDFLDRVAGVYGSRWGTFIAGRLGGKLVTLPTNAPDVVAAISRHEHLGERRFKPVTGRQNGSYGEVVSVVETDGEYRLRTGYSEQRPFPFARDDAWLEA